MTECDPCGYEEIAHTADWALHIWAPDFPKLLSAAIQGMQSLMGLTLVPGTPLERNITVEGMDREGLLVSALAEVLYLVQSESLGVETCQAQVANGTITATLRLRPIASLTKEIKAITYHGLSIQPTSRGLEATLVFDV